MPDRVESGRIKLNLGLDVRDLVLERGVELVDVIDGRRGPFGSTLLAQAFRLELLEGARERFRRLLDDGDSVRDNVELLSLRFFSRADMAVSTMYAWCSRDFLRVTNSFSSSARSVGAMVGTPGAVRGV